MPMNKPHLEFTRVDMNTGWATPTGYPAGIKQKILASDLDESGKTGSRTRLLRFEPGVYTTAPFVHDHWEEVYLISGDLIAGNDAELHQSDRNRPEIIRMSLEDRRVLIAGGGPVGLLCAWLLGRRGIPVRLFDENDGPQADPRA